MGENAELVQIIILAMIALFIGLRLRSVLGSRRADDPPPARPESFRKKHPGKKNEPGSDPAEAMGFGRTTFPKRDARPAIPGSDNPEIRKIFASEGVAGFEKFLNGAKSAYGLTLKEFWAGKMDQMAPYIEPDVLSGFKSAIETRKKEGQIVENRLLDILDTKLEEAEVVGDRAEITVRFESEIIAVVKDRRGKLLEGNMTDAIKVTDIWTFARHMKSRDPNWMLVATEAG